MLVKNPIGLAIRKWWIQNFQLFNPYVELFHHCTLLFFFIFSLVDKFYSYKMYSN